MALESTSHLWGAFCFPKPCHRRMALDKFRRFGQDRDCLPPNRTSYGIEMGTIQTDEVFTVASSSELAETGGGHNQKGVDFQRAWAIAKMFELEELGSNDFLFLFESVQDVAVLDSPDAPSSIHIYQIKKKDRGEWKWNDLTNLLAPNSKKAKAAAAPDIGDSPIGKLYASVIAFKTLDSCGYFLSNAGCDLKSRNDGNFATSMPMDLSYLEKDHLEQLVRELAKLHEVDGVSCRPSLLRIEKIPIHPDSPITYLVGLVFKFLSTRSPRHANQASALVDALMARIGPLGAKTDSCSRFEELRRERGYSRKEFVRDLGDLEVLPDQSAILDIWLQNLQAEGRVGFMTIAGIRNAGSRIFKNQLLGSFDPLTEALVMDCDKWIESNLVGPSISDYIDMARVDLKESILKSKVRDTEFLAHLLLRAALKCVDQTSEN